jgi:dihydroneopterin aldolase
MAGQSADTIFIRNLTVPGRIGVYAAERATPQPIVINLWLTTDTRRCASTDDVRDSVDYEAVVTRITELVGTGDRCTVEALAEAVADVTLALPKVAGVRVRVEKPTALGAAESVGVEINRARKE